MSFRQDARDVAGFSLLWLWGIVLVVIAAVVYLAVWGFSAPWVADRQREINHNSQQYQDAQIRESRNLLDGIMIAEDKGQKELLISRFCATNDTITDIPADISAGDAKYC